MCFRPLRIRVLIHVATTLPQLQAQIRGPPALESIHVQGADGIYINRYISLCDDLFIL